MGYGREELVGVCNWKIYGDKEVSYKVYNNFARDKLIIIFENNKKDHFGGLFCK